MPNENNFNSSMFNQLGVGSNLIECEAVVEGPIKKILCVKALANVVECVFVESGVSYVGEVAIECLFAKDEGGVEVVRSKHSFAGKIVAAVGTGKLVAQASCVGVDASGSTESCLKVVATIETVVCEIENKSCEVLQEKEGVVVLEKDVECKFFKCAGKEDFEIDANQSGGDEGEKLLFCESTIVMKEAVAANGYFTAKGVLNTKMMFEGEGGELSFRTQESSFSQEVEGECISKGDFVFAIATMQHEGNAAAGVATTAKIEWMCFTTETKKVVMDAYAPSFCSEVCESNVPVLKNLQECFFESKIDGSLVLGENHSRVFKVVSACCSGTRNVHCTTQNGKIEVVGVAQTNMVFVDEDEVLCSVEIEIPFNAESSIPENMTAQIVECTLKNTEVMVKKGRNVFFDAEVCCHALLVESQNERFVSKINVGEKKEGCGCGLKILFAQKDESVWSVAKKASVLEETILLQNPNISNPLSQNTKIVLFN